MKDLASELLLIRLRLYRVQYSRGSVKKVVSDVDPRDLVGPPLLIFRETHRLTYLSRTL